MCWVIAALFVPRWFEATLPEKQDAVLSQLHIIVETISHNKPPVAESVSSAKLTATTYPA